MWYISLPPLNLQITSDINILYCCCDLLEESPHFMVPCHLKKTKKVSININANLYGESPVLMDAFSFRCSTH